jgi:hypothetical protein
VGFEAKIFRPISAIYQIWERKAPEILEGSTKVPKGLKAAPRLGLKED